MNDEAFFGKEISEVDVSSPNLLGNDAEKTKFMDYNEIAKSQLELRDNFNTLKKSIKDDVKLDLLKRRSETGKTILNLNN